MKCQTAFIMQKINEYLAAKYRTVYYNMHITHQRPMMCTGYNNILMLGFIQRRDENNGV